METNGEPQHVQVSCTQKDTGRIQYIYVKEDGRSSEQNIALWLALCGKTLIAFDSWLYEIFKYLLKTVPVLFPPQI